MIAACIILILLQIGIIIFFVRRGRRRTAQFTNKPAVREETYASLRSMSLNITPAQLKLAIPATETLVYGMIMDWQMGDGITTLAAYITGAASLYFSTGGLIKGGGMKQSVSEAAVEFVVQAQEYLDRAMPVNITDLPAEGCVRFYFLTNKGIYGAQDHTKHFNDTTSPWLSLFLKGNMAINEIQGMVN